ncbi:ABC transporter substrate-binding protein [Allorhizocola rhizosphaerae]|uniref:ABC transporter substrate-binding protein n=1 Tax=Allorhizocola rhizosphaerae TaxID=1872709 RepID=UPI001B8B5861|nr:ABC transporter substrate-binding protein [Allorhizocola rhizosphaerae]
MGLLLTACTPIGPGETNPSTTVDNRPAREGGTLRVALSAEPDRLDPTVARTLVGRTVFNAICEKLYDVDSKLTIVPQLASALPEFSADGLTITIKLRAGVKFADGTPMDATAVKTSLDRHRTLPGSARTSELTSVDSVQVVDSATIAIKMKTPFAPLTAVLADRAGMVMSPAALTAQGENFGTSPVCVGPFKFGSRIAQDRIEVVKDPQYYDASKVHLAGVTYKIIADANTRFNNLRSGDVDVLDGVAATDVDALKSTSGLSLIASDSLGYQGITINLGNVDGVGKAPKPLSAPYASPLATDKRVRQAFELSLNREAINQVVFRGQFTPACGPISAASPFSSDAAQACPKHDPNAAKALLAQAGLSLPVKVSVVIGNTPDARRLGEAIQAQAKEGGFELELQPVEFAASLTQTDAGRYQTFQIGWSGRVDPDGNIANFVRTNGSQNISGYSNLAVDALLDEARRTPDTAKRRDLYGQVITKLHDDVPLIYLYRQKNLTGASSKVVGVQVYGDGLLRFATAGFAA